MKKYKLILFATKKDSSELEEIRAEVFLEDENRLFLLPSPEIFANGTSLSIKIEKEEAG